MAPGGGGVQEREGFADRERFYKKKKKLGRARGTTETSDIRKIIKFPFHATLSFFSTDNLSFDSIMSYSSFQRF